jgi:hypothetical protein
LQLIRHVRFATTLAVLALSCSSKSGPGSTSSGGGSAKCVDVTAQAFAPGLTEGWITAGATPSPDSGKSLYLNVELNEVGGYHQAPGSFDLSREKSYATCDHCVLGLVGAVDAVDASRVFFQSTGTLELDDVTSPPTSESKGTLTDVTLREATIDSTNAVKFVSNGKCLHVAAASWDTRVAPGTPCVSASDCGDPKTEGCDPTSGQCMKLDCNGTSQTCSSGQTCLAQDPSASGGVCTPTCAAGSSTSCAAGTECVPIDFAEESWICEKQGSATEGQACSGGDADTGCASGLLCVYDSGQDVCRTICNLFTASPGCPAGQACELGGACTTEAADPSAIDAPCSASADDTTPCGSDGSAYRGECVRESGTLMCRGLCRLDQPSDCPAGKTCQLTLHDTVGACE